MSTRQSDGCTCGGISACLTCQDADAGRAQPGGGVAVSDGLDLAAIRARAEAATPGPWEASKEIDGYYAGQRTAVRTMADGLPPHAPRRIVTVGQTRPHQPPSASVANVAHIAGMDPATTLALVDELEQLRAKIAAVERFIRGLDVLGGLDLKQRQDGLTATVEACEAMAADLRAALEGATR